MRVGLREVLESEEGLDVCGEAADISEGLALVRERAPDIALIDVSLPSGSGLDLAKQILAFLPATRILLVSMHDDVLFAERALRAGALGYVNKARSAAELLDAVRQVARGEIALSSSMTDRLVRRSVAPTPAQTTGVAALSDRELEVFELIGRGLGTRDIAERLCVSVKTVETHRERIKRKLEIPTATELSRRAALWLVGGNT
jgi:DNA-binding NarL/FixJ family response regulator